MSESATCLFCDQPAVAYCDAPIGYEPIGAVRDGRGKVKQLLTGSEATYWTCDAPMCAAHAKRVGFVCGTEPDSIDHCPYHVADAGEYLRDKVMFADEALAKRREVYAEIRRGRMAAVHPTPPRHSI